MPVILIGTEMALSGPNHDRGREDSGSDYFALQHGRQHIVGPFGTVSLGLLTLVGCFYAYIAVATANMQHAGLFSRVFTVGFDPTQRTHNHPGDPAKIQYPNHRGACNNYASTYVNKYGDTQRPACIDANKHNLPHFKPANMCGSVRENEGFLREVCRG